MLTSLLPLISFVAAMDPTEGADPALGGMAGGTALFARLAAFPLAGLRRRKLGDGDDATGPFYVPKPIQKAAALGLCVVLDLGVGILMGKPPIHAIATAASGCLLGMLAYDAQHKRGGDAEAKA